MHQVEIQNVQALTTSNAVMTESYLRSDILLILALHMEILQDYQCPKCRVTIKFDLLGIVDRDGDIT